MAEAVKVGAVARFPLACLKRMVGQLTRWAFLPNSTNSKYKNKRIEIDGHTFDSKAEANYYCELKMLKKAGVVMEFDWQVPFELVPKYKNANGETIRAIKYIADFVVAYADNHTEIVDVKGCKTDVYKLKKKLFDYIFRERGWTIKEIKG